MRSFRLMSSARRMCCLLALPLAVALVAASPAAAAAAPPAAALPVEVDLAAVLKLAREASPRLKVDREAVSVAEARRISAGLLPNPRIALGRTRPAGGSATMFDGREQTDTSIEFPLLLGGQRRARVEAAERFIEVARAQVGVGENLLAEEAAVAFVAILAAQARIDALAIAIDRIGRIRDIVAARESSGLASRYDVARVEVERAALQARLAEQQAEREDATGALSVLLGVPGWSPKAVGSLAPLAEGGSVVAGVAPTSAPAPAAVLPQGEAAAVAERARAAGLHPSVVAAQRQEAAAVAVVEVARRDRIPVPSLGIGRLWTRDPYGGANFIGVSVELPIFDTRRGPLEEARADARAAALRRTLVEAQVDASVTRFRNVVQRRAEALERFDSDAGARLPMLQTMAEDAYRFGRGSILEWLDATRTHHDQGLVRVDLVSGLAEARMRLRGALGVLGTGGW
jgi:cobalt-zinc-cadmium efflux system outer membrane protein